MELGITVGLTAQRIGEVIAQIITGTAPVLGLAYDGDTVADVVTFANDYVTTATGPVAIASQEMNISGAGWVAYNGATALAEGDTLQVRQNTSDASGNLRTFTSGQVTVLAALTAPTVSTAATFAGTPQVDVLLTGTPATFTGNPVPTVVNEFLMDGVVVATGTTYTPVTGDIDAIPTFRSTATNSQGTIASTSAGGAAVLPALEAPAVATAATFAGTPQVGVLLTGTPATFTGYPVPTVVNTWLMDGSTVATADTYTPVTGDLGAFPIFRSTGTNTEGSVVSNSAAGAAVIAAPTGLTQNVKVLVIGDSTAVGVGASPVGGSDYLLSRDYSFPLKARDWLNANGVTAIAESYAGDNGVGITHAALNGYRNDIALLNSPVTSSRSPSVGGQFWRFQLSSHQLDYTPIEPFDSFEFTNFNASGFGTLAVYVDDVLHSTYNQNVLPEAMPIEQITGLTLGIHKISFKASVTQAHGAGYVRTWDSAENSVQIVNAGVRGWTTANWILAGNAANPLNAIAALTPDITVIKIGINDYRTFGTTIATCTANIQTIIDAVVAVGSKVILCTPNPIGTYNTVTDAWSQAAVSTMNADIAAANPAITYLDFPSLYAANGVGSNTPMTYADLNGLGLTYDTFHMTAPVYEAEGNIVGDAIKAICVAEGWY